ncbi:hypothetical protein HMPREF2693_08210 [Staphylococcus sp. HMSC068D08]|uniref:hypothetical protein n=1 Tax=Staphylococcus TaxID=1279 RepID=UPI0008A4A97E|nr:MULTISPECIES: hypothetical protein [Staphylococcus]MCC2083150.1 hypothetical protein [Staphylococcus lugdunensis]MCH8679521.1 hypothetical protein [Staphylococcus lugdunensis]MCI2826547.1 hypothetical protein [Staphylococcus lugdunensis]MCI2835364.1 hypothetical protein [Staphylococcus lugdunensis]MCM3466390.1 hypothetical protein [Staphylococcus lugdunensis]
MEFNHAIHQDNTHAKVTIIDNEILKYTSNIIFPFIVGVILFICGLVVFIVIFGFLSAIITGQYSFVASGGIALVVSYSLFKGLHNKIFEKEVTLYQYGHERYEFIIGNQQYTGYYKHVDKVRLRRYFGDTTLFAPDISLILVTLNGTFKFATTRIGAQEAIGKMEAHFKRLSQ